MNGIDYYDTAPEQVRPTLSEILAGMTTEQKTGILEAYAHRPRRRSLMWCQHNLKVRRDVARWLYSKIEEIEQTMKKEVQNAADSDALKAIVKGVHSSANTGNPDDFNSGQCDAIVAKIISSSKYLGGANFTWYKANVK